MAVLKDGEAGLLVVELCRKHGIDQARGGGVIGQVKLSITRACRVAGLSRGVLQETDTGIRTGCRRY